MTTYDNIFTKYKSIKGKFESVYTIIANNMNTSELINNIDDQIAIAKPINDTYKRNYRLERLYRFKDYLQTIQDTKLNSIFIIHDGIVHEPLLKEWKDNLKLFDTDYYIFKYSDIFDFEYFKNLLTDVTYFDALHVTGNMLQHYHINKTKKKLQHKSDHKYLDIREYIRQHVKNPSIIYGLSLHLKDLKLDNHMVSNKYHKDEELHDIFEQYKNKQIEKDCVEWLNNLNHPKLGSRIVFGKDISIKISHKLLQKIYCSPEMKNKINTKIPDEYKIFEINEIKSFVNGDIGDQLQKTYSGIIGITFY